MIDAGSRKTVQLYFYTMTIERTKKIADDTAYCIDAIIKALANLLSAINAKSLKEKTHHIIPKSKVIWLEFAEDKGGGSFNLVFKSAKYDQSRIVRNTDTMESRGVLKQPEDGDEEKTHLLIRFRNNADRFIVACESNYFGASTVDIAAYLNEQFDQACSGPNEQYLYKVSFDPLPSEEFLKGLSKMKQINLLRLTVDIADLSQNDFHCFSGRDEIRSTVEIYLRKKRGRKNNISQDLISEVYHNTGMTKKIKRIAVEGSNKTGSLKIDSDSYQMKHSVTVETIPPTREVKTSDFFEKAQEFIREMGL